jgi:hypothetical protein
VAECDLTCGFVGYLRDGEDIERWRPKAERMLGCDVVALRAVLVTVPGD